MKFTQRTKDVLHYRRVVKRLIADGYEEVGENGGRLWEIHRGGRMGKIIKDVKIAPDGMSLFVKIGTPNENDPS